MAATTSETMIGTGTPSDAAEIDRPVELAQLEIAHRDGAARGSQVISARKMPIVPSVTMKGSIRPKVTIRPLARPQAAPSASATSHARRAPACRRPAMPALFMVHDHHAGDEGGHRADRQVEAAGGDHEGRADRDDGDEGAAGDARSADSMAVRKSGLTRAPATSSTQRAPRRARPPAGRC